MYLAALKYGVPLMRGEAIQQSPKIASDFALHPATVAAFNAWLKTVDPVTLSNIGDAMKFGMGQLLSWRTLRARIGTNDYVTEREFFKHAPEDRLRPHQIAEAVDKAQQTDPQMRDLNARLTQAHVKKAEAWRNASAGSTATLLDVREADNEITRLKTAIRTRTEALCGEIANPDAPPGPLPNSARPGEGPDEVCTNDQTDLREGAEEMRLLLGHLYPKEREQWQVRAATPADPPLKGHPAVPLPKGQPAASPALWIRRDPPGSDATRMTLVDIGYIKLHSARSTLGKHYDVGDDVLAKPVRQAIPFLKEHTSPEAVARLLRSAQAAIDLFDDYVHDSRCWFRVPHFREYAPGGYCWPRVVFVGGSERAAWLGFNPLSVALNHEADGETALA